MSNAWVLEVEEDRTTMKEPPPMPLEAEKTTPRHNAVATAASTACPPSLSIETPTAEHLALSAATNPPSDSITSP